MDVDRSIIVCVGNSLSGFKIVTRIVFQYTEYVRVVCHSLSIESGLCFHICKYVCNIFVGREAHKELAYHGSKLEALAYQSTCHEDIGLFRVLTDEEPSATKASSLIYAAAI